MKSGKQQCDRIFTLIIREGGKHLIQILDSAIKIKDAEAKVISISPEKISEAEYIGVDSSYNRELSRHKIIYGEDEIAKGQIVHPIKIKFCSTEDVEEFGPEEIEKIIAGDAIE